MAEPTLMEALTKAVDATRGPFSLLGAGEASWFLHKHGADLIAALQRIPELERRLDEVDGLVEAVRAEGHADECRGKSEGPELCDCPMSALAALDEASRG